MKKLILLLSGFLFVNMFSFGQADFKKIKTASSNQIENSQKEINWNVFAKWQKPSANKQTPFVPSPNFTFTSREDLIQPLQVRGKDKNGTARFISGTIDPKLRSAHIDEQIQQYLAAANDLLEMKEAEKEFKTVDSKTDKIGYTHYKMQQYINDIPVFGAEIILHEKNATIQSLNGTHMPTVNINADNLQKDASIPSSDVRALVESKTEDPIFDLRDGHSNWLPQEFNQFKESLVYYHHEDALKLAYHVQFYPNLGEWYTMFIDANDGSVINKYSNICRFHEHGPDEKHNCGSSCMDGPATATATDLLGQNVTINTYEVGNSYYMIDGSRPMFSSTSSNLPNEPVGVIMSIDAFDTAPQSNSFSYDHFTSFNNSWNDSPEAVSAQKNAGIAYDYFRGTHSRESINGSGGNIFSFTNVANEDGSSMGNAFWNGVAIFYGNGDQAFFPLGRALDVAGHEMTHGIIQNTANLEYYGESGAINESIADVMGAMMDRDDWLMGEDVVKSNFFPGGALRNMQDPHNGAPTGNYGAGWQPKHTNEQFTGSQDNGGVHINSGITNHAFYLIATGPNGLQGIGKDRMERITYRALDNYLTKSSQFVDLRLAMEQSASDLYGNTELNVVRAAFDQVGIGSGQGGNYQNDYNENPGQDLILYTDLQNSNLYLVNAAEEFLANPLSENDILSKPSITDDGSAIVYIGTDKKMYAIFIDWATGDVTADELSGNPVWRNVAVSRDGTKIAALTDDLNNQISVYDFGQQAWQDFDLYNPTYTEGITTGDVLYADVFEFDHTGNYVMYDAANRIESQNAGTIEYWDIGLIEVWNSAANTWALGSIEKIFPALPDGVSVGNPTFSKNSPYIIAFDFLDQDGNSVLGANLETGDVGAIYGNTLLGYPSFSNTDQQMIFDIDQNGYEELGIINLNDNKITATSGSLEFFFTNITPSQWGIWFSNGQRILSDVEEIAESGSINVFPNPAHDQLQLSIDNEIGGIERLEIIDMYGKQIRNTNIQNRYELQIDISDIPPGAYILSIKAGNSKHHKKIIIQ